VIHILGTIWLRIELYVDKDTTRGRVDTVPRKSDKEVEFLGLYLRNLLGGRSPGHLVVDLIVTLVPLLAVVIAGDAERGGGEHIGHGQDRGTSTTWAEKRF